MDSQKEALNLAVKLLSGQDYSKSDLIKKIKTKGISDEMANKIIERLKEQNLYKEEAYTNSLIKKRAKKGLSKELIQEELHKKGISVSSQEIQNIIEDFNIDPMKELKGLLKSKIPMSYNPGDFKQKEKLKAKLLRLCFSKGLDYEESFVLINPILNEDDSF